MRRSLITSFVAVLLAAGSSHACSCIPRQKSCESLNVDEVFVGRVVSTTSVKHPTEEKDSWTFGYTMKFEVEESLKGDLGKETTIETGNGGGDCGTPLPPGKRFFILAYRAKDGKLWTGMCMGNWALDEDATDQKRIGEYRKLTSSNSGSIFGDVTKSRVVWRDDDTSSTDQMPVAALTLRAASKNFSTTTVTAADGSYIFQDLPAGHYVVSPGPIVGRDYDHEYPDRYEADLANGSCKQIGFQLQPITRIRGHVSLPQSKEKQTVEVTALPTSMKKINQFSGKWDLLDEKGNFDLWPIPPGDYYVGVNINSTPKAESPFPPTYYPGVTTQSAARVIHLKEGDIQNLELPLPVEAKPRAVHFTAIGLDGKPLKTIYVQLEDMRHPGDAASYVNVDLDRDGKGTMTIYAGYSYHLHASHFVSYGKDWCAKPVAIPAGDDPVEAHFQMDRSSGNCDIYEIDHLKR